MQPFSVSAQNVSPAAEMAAPADNDVYIYGARKEKEDAGLPGQGTVFTPKDSSRQDLTSILAAESAVDFVDTGRINGSGFAVPRLRGQDTRSTEVWVDDFLIQDPLSGLPLIDEIDLRAFGTVRLFRGISPLNIHSAHHRGTIQFTPDFSGKQFRRNAGFTYGKPYGTSGFALIVQPAPEVGPAYRLFGREHVTRGDFSYYNDFATPYNSSDDRYSIRKNNHRRSRLFTPFFRWRTEHGLFKLATLYARSSSGIPTLNPHLTSLAEERDEQTLINASYTRYIESDLSFIPDYLSIEGHNRRGLSKIVDQSSDQFGFAGDREVKRQTAGGKTAAHWDFNQGSTEIAVSDQLTKITLNGSDEESTHAARVVTNGYGGLDFLLPAGFRLFQKWQLLRNADKIAEDWVRDQAFHSSTEQGKVAQSRLTAFAWEHRQSSIYLQYGQSEKLPSLLENFGDGGRIRPNMALTPEIETHREFGGTWKLSATQRTGISWFRDDTNDKIIFLPSISETTRAANIGVSQTTGQELFWEGQYQIFDSTLTWTKLEATDKTEAVHKKIPGIAEKQAALQIGISLAPVKFRAQHRYRSEVYRDIDNTIVSPETRFTDLFLDGELGIGLTEYRAGLSVLNVFDVKKSEINAPENPDGKGATASGDLSGNPLPGRQIKVTVETTF